MTYLSSQIRARLRTVAAKWLNDTCTIERAGQTQGTYGETVPSWIVVVTGEPCRLFKLPSSTAEVVGGQETITDRYGFAIAGGHSYLATDQRITVGSYKYDVISLETALTDEIFEQAIIERNRSYGES